MSITAAWEFHHVAFQFNCTVDTEQTCGQRVSLLKFPAPDIMVPLSAPHCLPLPASPDSVQHVQFRGQSWTWGDLHGDFRAPRPGSPHLAFLLHFLAIWAASLQPLATLSASAAAVQRLAGDCPGENQAEAWPTVSALPGATCHIRSPAPSSGWVVY